MLPKGAMRSVYRETAMAANWRCCLWLSPDDRRKLETGVNRSASFGETTRQGSLGLRSGALYF